MKTFLRQKAQNEGFRSGKVNVVQAPDPDLSKIENSMIKVLLLLITDLGRVCLPIGSVELDWLYTSMHHECTLTILSYTKSTASRNVALVSK